jgi:hypothetical protein
MLQPLAFVGFVAPPFTGLLRGSLRIGVEPRCLSLQTRGQ